uniref:Uncharacterized protein n=1 Tax=Rhizophora mucronata TaxID=61149 RepID=A0A2P2QR17_RHIMU
MSTLNALFPCFILFFPFSCVIY